MTSLHCQQTMLYTFNIFSVFACVCDDHNLLCNLWQALATFPTPQFMSVVEACCKCVHGIYSAFDMHFRGAGKKQIALELMENDRANGQKNIMDSLQNCIPPSGAQTSRERKQS